MKFKDYISLICLILLASGCAFSRSIVVETPVGPPRSVTANRSPNGELVVYSGFDFQGGGADSEYDNHHSDYKVFSFDGKLLKYVSNKVGTHIEDPATVGLPPGKYRVVAKAAAFGMVTVPVVIEVGKTTFVHLDGSELTGGGQPSTNDFVRLPDGLIIGWRAKGEAEPK